MPLMIYIDHATILTPESRLEAGAILIDQQTIVDIGPAEKLKPPPDSQRLDGAGGVLVPGFIDLQLNGGFGHDFTAHPETLWAVAAELPRYGVTTFLPTIITSPLETVAKAQAVLAQGA